MPVRNERDALKSSTNHFQSIVAGQCSRHTQRRFNLVDRLVPAQKMIKKVNIRSKLCRTLPVDCC